MAGMKKKYLKNHSKNLLGMSTAKKQLGLFVLREILESCSVAACKVFANILRLSTFGLKLKVTFFLDRALEKLFRQTTVFGKRKWFLNYQFWKVNILRFGRNKLFFVIKVVSVFDVFFSQKQCLLFGCVLLHDQLCVFTLLMVWNKEILKRFPQKKNLIFLLLKHLFSFK